MIVILLNDLSVSRLLTCTLVKLPTGVTTTGVMGSDLSGREITVQGAVGTGTTSGRRRRDSVYDGLMDHLTTFRNDNENSGWLPTNIKHVSEVTDDQVNRSVSRVEHCSGPRPGPRSSKKSLFCPGAI